MGVQVCECMGVQVCGYRPALSVYFKDFSNLV